MAVSAEGGGGFNHSNKYRKYGFLLIIAPCLCQMTKADFVRYSVTLINKKRNYILDFYSLNLIHMRTLNRAIFIINTYRYI
jgi:hypothetical protein